ncbi:MAG: hypothetical protein AAF756_15150 [Pseudomonadota bacterium]
MTTYKTFELYSKEQAEKDQNCGSFNMMPKRVLHVLDQLQSAPMATEDRTFLLMAAVLQGNARERDAWQRAMDIAGIGLKGCRGSITINLSSLRTSN